MKLSLELVLLSQLSKIPPRLVALKIHWTKIETKREVYSTHEPLRIRSSLDLELDEKFPENYFHLGKSVGATRPFRLTFAR